MDLITGYGSGDESSEGEQAVAPQITALPSKTAVMKDSLAGIKRPAPTLSTADLDAGCEYVAKFKKAAPEPTLSNTTDFLSFLPKPKGASAAASTIAAKKPATQFHSPPRDISKGKSPMSSHVAGVEKGPGAGVMDYSKIGVVQNDDDDDDSDDDSDDDGGGGGDSQQGDLGANGAAAVTYDEPAGPTMPPMTYDEPAGPTMPPMTYDEPAGPTMPPMDHEVAYQQQPQYQQSYEAQYGHSPAAAQPHEWQQSDAFVQAMNDAPAEFRSKKGAAGFAGVHVVDVVQENVAAEAARLRAQGVSAGGHVSSAQSKAGPGKAAKRKGQLSYLTHHAAQNQMELEQKRAQGIKSKSEVNARYGW